jgi:geranylgeranyl diphosphate synthase type II
MFDLKKYLAEKRQIINNKLRQMLAATNPGEALHDAMNYALMAGGKRIRPILCLAAAEAVDGRSQEAIAPACALEMIHTYSLIHDDLPAMDDDDLRRGKPTCHVAFDEATAILTGDALLTLAFEILSSESSQKGNQPAKFLRIIGLIAEAAGSRGMIQGQMLDMAAQGRVLTVSELESMHALKTGALIEASMQCGALMAGADEVRLKDLITYARKIGLAFQVADDILNVEGNPEVMGKAVGTDQLHRKNTYPSLLGLQASKQLAQKLVRQALQAIETFDKKAEPLRALATYIIERNR